MTHTAESVTFLHPDKICDQISDAVLDECLKQDPFSRVAVETLGGHNSLILIGEVTTKGRVDFAQVARDTYFSLTKKDIGVLSNIITQCPEISQGVNKGGAGDQGIVIGYACDENEMKIPQELYLAKELLKSWSSNPFEARDGKSQVTIKDGKITEVVLSIQHETKDSLELYLRTFFKHKTDFNAYCNNTGSFNNGGFDADSGVTGRKIVVDQYGPRVPIGGGAFSGKDPTKVDRSGAYMARWIALKLMKTYGAKEVLVKIGYVIGKTEPIMTTAIINGEVKHELDFRYDCRPEAIIEKFDLRRPIYLQTAREGHFGNKEYPWEKI